MLGTLLAATRLAVAAVMFAQPAPSRVDWTKLARIRLLASHYRSAFDYRIESPSSQAVIVPAE